MKMSWFLGILKEEHEFSDSSVTCIISNFRLCQQNPTPRNWLKDHCNIIWNSKLLYRIWRWIFFKVMLLLRTNYVWKNLVALKYYSVHKFCTNYWLRDPFLPYRFSRFWKDEFWRSLYKSPNPEILQSRLSYEYLWRREERRLWRHY